MGLGWRQWGCHRCVNVCVHGWMDTLFCPDILRPQIANVISLKSSENRMAATSENLNPSNLRVFDAPISRSLADPCTAPRGGTKNVVYHSIRFVIALYWNAKHFNFILSSRTWLHLLLKAKRWKRYYKSMKSAKLVNIAKLSSYLCETTSNPLQWLIFSSVTGNKFSHLSGRIRGFLL